MTVTTCELVTYVSTAFASRRVADRLGSAAFRLGQSALQLIDPTQQLVQTVGHRVGRGFARPVVRTLDEERCDVGVSRPNRAIPVTIRNAAAPLPAGVTGNLSP